MHAYRRYLLLVLAVILAFNYVDRLALGIVLQDIKRDLQVSDTQLGLLTGIAFASFYSVMGIFIGRWIDRGNRVSVIATTTALWSVAVALCGAAGTFAQLLLCRVGVAIGEAGCLPSALSLIAAYFPRAERPRAMALYLQGGSLSLLIGYMLAGWINQFFGWRLTFVSLGLPGIGLALLAWHTLDEPRVPKSSNVQIPADEQPGSPADQPGLKVVLASLQANKTFRHLVLFLSISLFFNFGLVQWQPAFLVRSFGLSTGELGTWIAVACGLGAMSGTYLGGEWSARHAANNEPLQLRVMAVVYCAVGLTSSLIYLSPNRYCAFAFLALWNAVATTTNAPIFALLQTLVPERMRATAMMLALLCANLIGMGLGPLAVGALSDALRPWLGDQSLRYALLAMSPGFLWGGWQLRKASFTVTHDLEMTLKILGTDGIAAIPILDRN